MQNHALLYVHLYDIHLAFLKYLPNEGILTSVYQDYLYQYLSWDRKNISNPYWVFQGQGQSKKGGFLS